MTRRKRNPTRVGRRSFLAGLGVSLAAAPFIPMLESQASGNEFPRRLVLVFSPNGSVESQWRPSGTETNFTMGPILKPLEPFQEKLNIIYGMRIPNLGPGVSHARGIASIWSGHTILPGNKFEGGDGKYTGWGGGISVDQLIANELDPQTPFRTLEFAVQPGQNELLSRMCYAGPDAPIPPEPNPTAMFKRLFGEFGLEEAEFEALKARRQSVIDVVREDLRGLETRVSTGDKHKIESHLDAVRSIEKRLDAPPWGEACMPPEEPTLPFYVAENYPEIIKLQTDLLVMALACGLTDIASLQMSRAVGNHRHTWLGISQGHHEISHLPDSDSTAVQNLIDINTWYSARFADLLAALDAVPEGEGTMLDNCMVVIGNELGKGNDHKPYPIPFYVAGGCGGKIETGRYLNFANGIQHSKLLVSICHAMGLDHINSIGDMDTENPGPMPGLVS